MLFVGENFQAHCVLGNVAGSHRRVLQTVVVFEGRERLVVETVRGAASVDHDSALEEVDADIAGDETLGFGAESLNHFALGGEPEAVVAEFGIFRHEHVLESDAGAVHADGFEVAMRFKQDGSCGGVVNAAGLHLGEAGFDDVDGSDRVVAADFVEFAHELGGRESLAVDRDGDALFEGDDDVFRFIFGLGDGLCHDPHVFEVGSNPRIFEILRFEGDVEEVAVHGVGFFDGSGDVETVFLAVVDHVFTAFERPEVGAAPGGENLERGIKRVDAEFEADLVVSAEGCEVHDGVGAFLMRELDETFCDGRTGEGGSEEIFAFIHGVHLQSGEVVVADEVFGDVGEDAFFRAESESFRLKPVGFLFHADVRAVRDDFSLGVLMGEEMERRCCVESAGEGEDDFLVVEFSRVHDKLLQFSLIRLLNSKIPFNRFFSTGKFLFLQKTRLIELFSDNLCASACFHILC